MFQYHNVYIKTSVKFRHYINHANETPKGGIAVSFNFEMCVMLFTRWRHV